MVVASGELSGSDDRIPAAGVSRRVVACPTRFVAHRPPTAYRGTCTVARRTQYMRETAVDHILASASDGFRRAGSMVRQKSLEYIVR